MADWHGGGTNHGSGNTSTSIDRNNDGPELPLPFCGRRSPVICRNGCVATSQPLASSIGLRILWEGGNAADAAVAIAAALAVLEPCSTGLGGDMFCLYYHSQTAKVTAINGSGKSPSHLTLERVQTDFPAAAAAAINTNNNHKDGSMLPIPVVDEDAFGFSAHAVTVPGAARGWEDTWKTHGSGKFTFAALLEPAAQLAEEGFVVSTVTSHHWCSGMHLIQRWCQEGEPVPLSVGVGDHSTSNKDGNHNKNGPKPGQIMVNPDMARVLRELGRKGATDGFYLGTTGRAIVDAVQRHGGTMTLDDLAQHTSSLFPTPMSTTYRHVRLWECPPNGQGVAALVALAGLDELEQCGMVDHEQMKGPQKDAAAWHAQFEMMRLGFDDARRYVGDPDTHTSTNVDNDWLTDRQRIGDRVKTHFNPTKATIKGDPTPNSCTVSFQVVDKQGNAISFVNSNYMGFGTGIVPKNCGFTLQNRGFGFDVNNVDDLHHPNVLGPGKRPCHTILPGMLTHADDTNDLYATLTNMGGQMQPQGHLQLTFGLVSQHLNPQEAIDAPRFCIRDGTYAGKIFLEDGVDPNNVDELIHQYGHDIVPNVSGHARSVFGRAQIIQRDRTTGVLWAGSDGRCDGCAMGY